MEDLVKQRLENQAFAATVIGSGTSGLMVHDWISLLVKQLGGYIGDVVVGGGDDAVLRTVIARQGGESQGVDIVPTVMKAFNDRLSSMRNPAASEVVVGIASMLRRFNSAGGLLECSMTGCEFAFDFVRGRHMVTLDGDLMAMHVHGRTVTGRVFDSASSVLSVYPDGACELSDGSSLSFVDVSKDEPHVPGGEIASPERPTAPRTALVDRIMKSRAGSLAGPEPTGMVISKGEDGRVMIALRLEPKEGGLSVRFLPTAVQLLLDGRVEAQSGFERLDTVLEWLQAGTVEVCRIGDAGGMDWAKVPVEIRASA